MPKIGALELIIVLVIVLLIFGVGRLGQLGKDLGEGIRGFRESMASNEDQSEEKTNEAG
ncbi:MAG: twin-arginine translocase TatA/TatE family subunit [Chloroflexi bacterium]|nr:twin-arginine translocase TatA/TatE family subunit [Chloroflexota bacterium]